VVLLAASKKVSLGTTADGLELHLTGSWLTRLPILQFGLALQFN
jgi:hypothetical protein